MGKLEKNLQHYVEYLMPKRITEFMELLLNIRHLNHPKFYMDHFHLHNNPARWVSEKLFYSWGSEQFNDFTKATQLKISKAGKNRAYSNKN